VASAEVWRRLSARPSSVALEPTGANMPTPAVRRRARDFVRGGERRGDRFGALARQRHVVLVRALAVGVADDEHGKLGLAGEQLGDFGERRPALRLDHRSVGVEIDSVERDMALVAETLRHCRGVDHLVGHFADHGDDQLGGDLVVVLAGDDT
jgi:hypothetical protein